MADSSSTRHDAKIEAAAAAMTNSTGAFVTDAARERAAAALAAADSVERPAVERLVAALADLVEIMDPEEGSWPQDLSTCPYYRRGLPGADPSGQCGFGCSQEPECQTCRPRDGWPLEVARNLLAEFGQQPTGDEA